MSKNLVVKDNALINASYNLDLVEQRLILLSVIEARATGKGITPNDTLVIPASSYMNNFGTDRNASYKALKEACNSLFERQFSYYEINENGNRKIVRSRWVSKVAYLENEALVELIFSPDVAPLITMLEKNFTSYNLEQVAGLSSKYAVRLYEIIIAWRSQGKTNQLTVEQLRERLGIEPSEYVKMELFKRKVLDFSIAQINEKTDITISYEQHKQGRKIVAFTFKIEQKQKAQPKNAQHQQQRDGETIDMLSPIKMTDKQRLLFASKLSHLPECSRLQGGNESYEALARFIADDLLKAERVDFYRPLLSLVGYVEH